MKSKQEESTWADRWGIFIYICQPVFPFFFPLLMLMMWFNRQHCARTPSIKHTHELVSRKKKKKSSLPACLVRSWMGKTNKHQTSATQHKLYFIIKWLLIHVSCSYSCFDQRKIVTKMQLSHSLLSTCSSAYILMQWQRYCLLTATAVN